MFLLYIFFHVALSKPKNSFRLFSHPLVHCFLVFLFSFSFTFLHTKPHTLHHILVKDFKIFRTRSSAGAAFFLLLSPTNLLSKERSWFAISRPWTRSSIAFFLLEGKLSGQVHSIVVCEFQCVLRLLYFVYIWLSFELWVPCVWVLFLTSQCEAKKEGFLRLNM